MKREFQLIINLCFTLVLLYFLNITFILLFRRKGRSSDRGDESNSAFTKLLEIRKYLSARRIFKFIRYLKHRQLDWRPFKKRKLRKEN